MSFAFLVLLCLVAFLVLLRLVTFLGLLSPDRRSRVRLGGSRLLDYDAISRTRTRNKRYKTKIIVGATSAVGTAGEIGDQRLRTWGRRTLRDMS
jgi:hypothetical protein